MVSRLSVVLDGDTVKARVKLIDNVYVTFSARRIQSKPSGFHASISIDQGSNNLAWGLINFERPSDRVTMNNAAHAMLPEQLKPEYSKLQLKADFDQFCKQLWDTHNTQFVASFVAGDPDSVTEWFCPPLIMQDGSTILFGQRGGGKSITAMTAAISTQHGMTPLWGPIEMANVLYINIERGQKSMERRIARVNLALGLSAYEPLLMLNARGKSLDFIFEAARRSIKAHEVQVVFFDSLSRSGAGDLNDNQPANAVMDMLSDLTPTWLAVAHMTKQEGGTAKVFGSQMYENAIDVAVKLTGDQQGDNLGVGLEITKANDTALGQNQYIKYEFNGTGLVGIKPSNVVEFPKLAAKASLWEGICSVLRNKPSSVEDMADELNTTSKNITAELRASSAFVRIGNLWSLQGRAAEPPS